MYGFSLGSAVVHPDQPIIAGSYTTITFTYIAGHPIDDSGYLKITFRSVSDAGTPQFTDPDAPNFCTINTTGDCQIEPRWDSKGHTRPWSQALYLHVRRGFLDSREKIQVIFGDVSYGSPGWQVQTNCIDQFEFKTFVDPIATYQFKELPNSPKLMIIPGKPVRLVCISPSQVRRNQKFFYYIKWEDKWGNPTQKPQKITHPGWKITGIHFISVKDNETSLSTQSNPVDVIEDYHKLKPFWADFHGQSGETVGDGTIEGYFSFAKNFGLLDIAAHQGNDFQVTDEFWEKINATSEQFHTPEKFITFPGYEWSSNTPLGGDRNVYFESEGGKITRSSTELLPNNTSKYPDSPTAEDLFVNLAKQDDPKAFTFAHVGGRFANLDSHNPDIELAVEVHSAWGTFEWIVEEALKRGYRIGICGNSDGHKCRPGASYPGAAKFGSLGGLTCILASELNRISVLEALKSRHFYATTGVRPLLDLTVSQDNEKIAMIGDIVHVTSSTPVLHFRGAGTSPVESILVRNGIQDIMTFRPYTSKDLGNRIKIIWSGAEVRGRDRMVEWDGNLEVQGNLILDAIPINFWNPDHPIEKINPHRLVWNSTTTGGLAGVIISLEHGSAGWLDINTTQNQIRVEIKSVGIDPLVWICGGLKKQISIYRLPDQLSHGEYTFSMKLDKLHAGDNPIYIRMNQEDGHMAWTSPIYLVKSN